MANNDEFDIPNFNTTYNQFLQPNGLTNDILMEAVNTLNGNDDDGNAASSIGSVISSNSDAGSEQSIEPLPSKKRIPRKDLPTKNKKVKRRQKKMKKKSTTKRKSTTKKKKKPVTKRVNRIRIDKVHLKDKNDKEHDFHLQDCYLNGDDLEKLRQVRQKVKKKYGYNMNPLKLLLLDEEHLIGKNVPGKSKKRKQK